MSYPLRLWYSVTHQPLENFMKPSHLTTPRTMNECVFMLNADPIERPEHRVSVTRFATWFTMSAAIVTIMLLTACGTPRPQCSETIYGCNSGNDRCDDPTHFDRQSCPHCKSTGWALWSEAGREDYVKYRMGWGRQTEQQARESLDKLTGVQP